MFRRRRELDYFEKTRSVVWPRGGWLRFLKYVGYRVLRIPGTPYSIAAGFAAGVAMSMTPFVGLHFVFSALLAWALGANIIASALGTFIGNPWTFPFIWVWIYFLGNAILGGGGGGTLPDELSLGYLIDNPFRVLFPMAIGSVPTAIVAWFAVYFPVRGIVSAFQTRRRLRRERKQAKAEAKAKRGDP